MIINHSQRFIFIHTPKAAGTSVTSKLSERTRYCDQEIGGNQAIASYYVKRFGLRKHSTASQVRAIVGDQVWSDYFTFAFVRNPYARLVSAYNFLCKWEGRPPGVLKRLNKLDTVDKFLASRYWSDEPGPDNIFLPQAFWVCETERDTQSLVDYVGRTETLTQDMGMILHRIDGGERDMDAQMPALNVSGTGESMSDLWTPALTARVEARYAPDFEAFYPDARPPLAAS